ncbi:hypothetical protein [Pseudolysinimonas sp.]|jgi:hypothetical protein|uniref:hypothetical protein n=1 Tax=Pseudolysinimonas sp. TaxID=2680009 RepID=UPI0037834A33
MTEPTEFDPARSEAIRAELVDVVDERPVRGGRRLGAGIGLVLAGMLVGGGAATATAAIWDRDPGPAPSYPTTNFRGQADAVFIPGAPVVTPLAGSIVFTVAGEPQAFELSPPADATHVRVTFTCTSPGATTWGLDEGGNNPSTSCSASDLRPGEPSPTAWIDFDLADGSAVYLQPRDGATSVVSLQYLAVVETAWGINERGETFGASKPGVGDPDLMAVLGVDAEGDAVTGYARATELVVQCPGASPPMTPEQANEQQERCDREYPAGFDVPVYRSDGVTQIGTFHVG